MQTWTKLFNIFGKVAFPPKIKHKYKHTSDDLLIKTKKIYVNNKNIIVWIIIIIN